MESLNKALQEMNMKDGSLVYNPDELNQPSQLGCSTERLGELLDIAESLTEVAPEEVEDVGELEEYDPYIHEDSFLAEPV